MDPIAIALLAAPVGLVVYAEWYERRARRRQRELLDELERILWAPRPFSQASLLGDALRRGLRQSGISKEKGNGG